MNSNFILLQKYEMTMDYIEKLLINYPKKDVVLRNYIEKCMFKGIELIHTYNVNNNARLKNRAIKDLIVSISMLDYYIRLSFKRKIIRSRNVTVVGNFIIEVRKMSYGLIKHETQEID